MQEQTYMYMYCITCCDYMYYPIEILNYINFSCLDYQAVCLGASIPASHFWYSSEGSVRAEESCLPECFHIIRLE